MLIFAVAAAACNRAPQPDANGDQAGQPPPPSEGIIRPDRHPDTLVYMSHEKTDTMQIEGGRQAIRVRLVQPSASVPFLTYAPEDFLFEQKRQDNAEAFYFYTNFAGKKNENAYLLLVLLPTGTTQEDAVARVKAFASTRGAPPPAQYEGFSFKRGGIAYFGSLDLRKHADRFYYIATQFPQEYGDGFAPRARIVQDEWKWLD